MNKILNKTTQGLMLAVPALFAFVVEANAQTIGITSLNAQMKIGNIESFAHLVQFLINFVIYTGWVGAVFGVGAAIALIIWRSMSGDSEEAVKNFQSYMTKAVLLVVAGILLACFGYIIKIVVTFIPGLGLTSADSLDVAGTANPFGGSGQGGVDSGVIVDDGAEMTPL